MTEWLRAPESWIGIFGTIVGLAGLIVSWKSRKRRVLRYGFTVRRQVFSNQFVSHLHDFDLRLNGAPVRELFLVELFVTNKGNETLFAADFLQPLRLQFEAPVTLVPLNTTRARTDVPLEHVLESTAEGPSIVFTTPLIEPGNRLRAAMLYEHETHAQYRLDGRIIGGRLSRSTGYEEGVEEDFEYRVYRKYKHQRTTGAMLSLLVATGALALIARLAGYARPITGENGIFDGLIGIVLVVLLMRVASIPSDRYFDRKEKAEREDYERNQEERKQRLTELEQRAPRDAA